MLTILYPSLIPDIKSLQGGLQPFRHKETGKVGLIIKAQKEMILTARMNQGFKFYVAPLQTTTGITPALITAFFDDHDEPLTVRTPLFNDDLGQTLGEMLYYDEMDVYFFDEHNREWMSYQTKLHDGGSCLRDGTELRLIEFSPQNNRAICSNLEHWFSYRTSQDDSRSISVTFLESLAPDDILITNAVQEDNDYLGGEGFSYSDLVRDNPGSYQERDIVASLRRVFRGEQIAINPFRKDNRKEFVDVLVVTDTHVLFIQAKDSPNTYGSLRRTIERKRQTSHAQLDKGIKQVKGAAAYVKTHKPLELLIGNEEVNLHVGDRKLLGLLIIKEAFLDEGERYVTACEDLRAAGQDGVVLDYPAFHGFAHRLTSEDRFLAGLKAFQEQIIASGSFPNPQDFLINYTEENGVA